MTVSAIDGKIRHKYRPRGSQAELWERTDKEILMSGPAGTGKSRACLEKLHFLALVYPNLRALLLRSIGLLDQTASTRDWPGDRV